MNSINVLRQKIRDAGLSAHIDIRYVEGESGVGYELTDDGGRHCVDTLNELSALVDESIQSYVDLEC